MSLTITPKIHTTTAELGYLDAAIFHIAQIVTKIAARIFDQTDNYTAYLTYLDSNNATAWQSGRFMAMQNSRLAGTDKIDTWVADNTSTDLKILALVAQKTTTISRDTYIAFLQRQMEDEAPALPLGKLASSIVFTEGSFDIEPILDALDPVLQNNRGDWGGLNPYCFLEKDNYTATFAEIERLVDAEMAITTRELFKAMLYFAKDLKNSKMFLYLLEKARVEGNTLFTSKEIIDTIVALPYSFAQYFLKENNYTIPANELRFWLPHASTLAGQLNQHVGSMTAAVYLELPIDYRLTLLPKVENMIASLDELGTIPALAEEECKRIIRHHLQNGDYISPQLFMALAQYLIKTHDRQLVNKLIRSSNLADATLPKTFHKGGDPQSIAAIIAANASLET